MKILFNSILQCKSFQCYCFSGQYVMHHSFYIFLIHLRGSKKILNDDSTLVQDLFRESHNLLINQMTFFVNVTWLCLQFAYFNLPSFKAQIFQFINKLKNTNILFICFKDFYSWIWRYNPKHATGTIGGHLRYSISLNNSSTSNWQNYLSCFQKVRIVLNLDV